MRKERNFDLKNKKYEENRIYQCCDFCPQVSKFISLLFVLKKFISLFTLFFLFSSVQDVSGLGPLGKVGLEMSVALWDKGAISDPLRASHPYNYIGSGVKLGLIQKVADLGLTMSVNMDLGIDKDVDVGEGNGEDMDVDIGEEDDEYMDVDIGEENDEYMDVDIGEENDEDFNMDVDVQV